MIKTLLSLSLVLCVSFISMSSSNGIGDDRTGSPNAASNCGNSGSCHNGGNLNASISIVAVEKGKITPVTAYKANTTYTITIAVTSLTSLSKGFQSVVLNTSNTQSGTLSNPSAGSQVISANSRSIAVQTSASTTGIWSYDWKAPASPVGSVTIYASGVAGNGADGFGGDQPVSTNKVLTLDNSAKVQSNSASSVSFYPNPVVNEIHFTSPQDHVQIFDLQGKLVLEQHNTSLTNVHGLTPGYYNIVCTKAGLSEKSKLLKLAQ
jgi:hypothetical protein